MITLERARYLCSIDDTDEATATRDLITAISEAEDILDASCKGARRADTGDARVLYDYMMGHTRERDPYTYNLLQQWPWRAIEYALYHNTCSLPFSQTATQHTLGMDTRIHLMDTVARGGGLEARDVTLAEIDQALSEWLSVYRIHFADHPAPSYGPLRRMVFLPFAVWPNATHDMALASVTLEPPTSIPHPPRLHIPRYNHHLLLANVARALPNASPQRPAPPLHVVSSGDAVMVLGKGMKPPPLPDILGASARLYPGQAEMHVGALGRVHLSLLYQDHAWRTHCQGNAHLRFYPLIEVWKTCIRMDAGLYDPGAMRYAANIMQGLWHSPESSPSAPHDDDTTP